MEHDSGHHIDTSFYFDDILFESVQKFHFINLAVQCAVKKKKKVACLHLSESPSCVAVCMPLK